MTNPRIHNFKNSEAPTIVIFFLFLFVFVFSSATKSLNIYSYALETRLYIDAYMWEWIRSLSMIFSIVVCVIEMTIALLAINKEYIRVASTGFFLMLSFFVYLTGLNLFFPTIMGSIESCGCFGELIHFSPLASFIKSVVLWILSLVLVINSFRSHEPWNIVSMLKDRYTYICVAVSLVLPLYSLWLFNKLDHTVYICVFVGLCIALAVIVWIANTLKRKLPWCAR